MSYGFDKTKISDLDKKKVFILNYQLAFENYEDNTSKKVEEVTNLCKMTSELRHDNLEKDESIKLADEIISGYEKLFQSLTDEEKKRFVFYKDGDINYIWDMSLLNK